MTHVLIAGISTRAAAESAALAGFAVTAIDAFGDLDQHPSVRGLSMADNFTASSAALMGQTIECDAVVYLSNFENHPKAINTITEGRALWGNSAAVVRRVRDPLILAEALGGRGISVPEVRLKRDGIDVTYPDRKSNVMSGSCPNVNQWLVKPIASGGGQRIRLWDPATSLPRGCYLQQLIGGLSGSIVFVAARGRAVPLAVSLQLVGESAFGAEGFRYCGNILTPAPRENTPEFFKDRALVEEASTLAQAAAEEFGLVGVNGIDFIVRDNRPWPIEVNPRWCASMELVERAYGLSVFETHASACISGKLPDFDLGRARRDAGAFGKAVVYARRNVGVDNTETWRAKHKAVRDIPQPEEQISVGRPVCTVFATGRDTATCHEALVHRAADIYAHLHA